MASIDEHVAKAIAQIDTLPAEDMTDENEAIILENLLRASIGPPPIPLVYSTPSSCDEALAEISRRGIKVDEAKVAALREDAFNEVNKLIEQKNASCTMLAEQLKGEMVYVTGEYPGSNMASMCGAAGGDVWAGLRDMKSEVVGMVANPRAVSKLELSDASVLVRDLKKGDLFRLNEGGNVLERIADEPAAHSTDTFVARDNAGMCCYILRGGYEVSRVEKPVDEATVEKENL